MSRLISTLLLVTSCGRIHVTDSDHKVKVEGETKHTIQISAADCNEILDQDRKEDCIEKWLDIMTMLLEARNNKETVK